MAEREIAHAQTAFLAGNLNQCAMHLSNAMSAGAGPYPGAYAQAPYPGGPYAEAPGPYAEAPGPYAEAPGPYAAEEAPYPHTYAAPPPGPYHQGPSPYVNTMGPPRY
jgi:hypothetical protein